PGGTVPGPEPEPTPTPQPQPQPIAAKVTLTTDAAVVEGGKILVTASVDVPVRGTPLEITLTNGSVITIPVGSTTGTVEIDSRPDDVYVQGESAIDIGI